jgi:leucyl aminopeptidase
MKITIDADGKKFAACSTKIQSAFTKGDGEEKTYDIKHWKHKKLEADFSGIKATTEYDGSKDFDMFLPDDIGTAFKVIGLGSKKKYNAEKLRKSFASAYKSAKASGTDRIGFRLDSFKIKTDLVKTLSVIVEAIELSDYSFDIYKSKPTKANLKEVVILVDDKRSVKKLEKALESAQNLSSSVNFCRDLVNEAPNVLNSEEYSKRVQADVKKALKGKGVKVKILGHKELKKEGCNLFLSVNNGSAHEPQLVHLEYTPKKVTKNTKHIALVGKGLTFDSGGYSLKPSGSMMGMKFDMGGSATVYGAFRAAVLNDSPYKISCFLGMTDNMVNEYATTPDSIVKGRNGKTVEILNTDAEGRLVLADVLSYASDLNPDVILDAATLTGACLVALGDEVCAILGNDDKTIADIKKSAKNADEYVWELPIIPEFREQMKSKIADLKNIGKPARAGTATAAAFLEEFVGEGIKWVHFDIAGVCDSQAHLPYCPANGGSGLIVRTMYDYLS